MRRVFPFFPLLVAALLAGCGDRPPLDVSEIRQHNILADYGPFTEVLARGD